MSQDTQRPWPLVLLTAVGAWLAAIPLLIAVGMLLGDALRHGVAPYLVGLLALGAAVVVLRARAVSAFVEQLAVPALLVGLGTLGMGVYQDWGNRVGSVLMCAVVVALAFALPKNWLRVLLGAAAAGFLGFACVSESGWLRLYVQAYGVLHGLLAVGLVLAWRTPALAFSTGWLLASLAGLAWVTGSTFLVGGAVGSSDAGQIMGWFMGEARRAGVGRVMPVFSSGLVLAAAVLGVRAWPAQRSALVLCLALVLAVLAWFMPTLGAAVFALVATCVLARWRLAAACAVTAAWIVGAFYYQLQWPLGDKALVLMLAGVVLGGMAWWEHQRHTQREAQGGAPDAANVATAGGSRVWLLVGGTLLVLLVANGAIWQKQDLIANGKRVLIALAPVDPRSLMQGDYMRLRFTVLDNRSYTLLGDLAGQRPQLVMALDARGVASAVRPHRTGQPLGADEFLLELTPKDGNWVIVTDAWFFKEGEGALWQEAKFGEFRVLPNGKALLVGMADAQLRPIVSGP